MAVLLGLAVLPLGLLAWIALSGSRRSDYLRSAWVRAGFAAAATSALPLLVVVALSRSGLWPDPNPNPIGLGLLLFMGGFLATILIAVGISRVDRRQ